MTRARRRPPVLVVAVALTTVAFFALPLIGLIQRAELVDIGHDLTTPVARDAFRLSLICSLSRRRAQRTVGHTAGLGAGANRDSRDAALLRGLVLLPLVLPPVVAGVALLTAFSRTGLVGRWLYDALGIQLTFSIWGAILAETFVALPFFVITVEAALASVDRRFEDVAASLGAPPRTVFRRVTVPLILPSLVAGLVLAWARALGEFGATITFAGNIQGRTQTLPLAVYLQLEGQPGSAIAMSLVLLVVSLVVLVSLRDRWLRPA